MFVIPLTPRSPRGLPISRLSCLAGGLAGMLAVLAACAPARERSDGERVELVEQVDQAGNTSAGSIPEPVASGSSGSSDEFTIAGSHTMSEQAPVDLGLTDADYWDNPFKTRLELENQWLATDQPVLAVGAPSKVGYSQRETLPLLVMRVGQQDAIARLPFQATALVVAQELQRNKTYVNMAVTDERGVPPTPYDGPPLEGKTGEAWLVDVRKQLEMPWQRSELLVSVIIRDTMTQRLRIKIGKGGYEDPAAEQYLAEQDQKPQPAEVYPRPLKDDDDGKTLPSYRKQPDSPALPDGLGINLAVPRVIARNPHMRVIVHGSFRLRVLPRERAPGRVYSAVVPITLISTGSDLPAPYQFDLHVPIYDQIETVDGEAQVSGYFSFDLQSLANVNVVDQTLFLYAFSGELVTGPVPMALVSR
jgi:hypothetical protein